MTEYNFDSRDIIKRKIIFRHLSFLFLIYSFTLAYPFQIPKKTYTIPLLCESIHNSVALNA